MGRAVTALESIAVDLSALVVAATTAADAAAVGSQTAHSALERLGPVLATFERSRIATALLGLRTPRA